MTQSLLRRFLPHQSVTPGREMVRASIGACLGLGLTAAISTRLAGASGSGPLLIAPMGASAVLLFAVPASPLAQPSAMLGENLIAALTGVTMAWLIPTPFVAAPLAVGIAIALMALCRCVHPPSGAVALVTVLGGPHVLAQGYGFVISPVLLNSMLLVVAAMLWNNLTGRSYPHAAHPVATPAIPVRRVPTLADYEAVIADYGETLSIDAGDLQMLHEALNGRALATV